MPTVDFQKELQKQQSGEAIAILVTITHETLTEPLRLSTDSGKTRLSTDPLVYGIRSRLLGSESANGNLAQPADFLFALMSAVLPENREQGVTSTDIIFENVDAGMIDVARELKTPATVDFAVVLSSTPDYVDFEWTDLRTVAVDYDEASITISVSREDVMGIACPFGHMTRSRFPGLAR